VTHAGRGPTSERTTVGRPCADAPEERAAGAVTPGPVRPSVDLESIDDIVADLDRGVAAV
jgi:O-acetylhomoserine/O-acetylserine sulfhydrylase-like pyridoxal-dependent enzyme